MYKSSKVNSRNQVPILKLHWTVTESSCGLTENWYYNNNLVYEIAAALRVDHGPDTDVSLNLWNITFFKYLGKLTL